MATTAPYVGKAMKRKEDPRLIQGMAHYVDDIQLAGMLHMAVVRSPHAHARLGAVDLSKARNATGVVAAFSGEELRGVIGMVPCAAQIPDMTRSETFPKLAPSLPISIYSRESTRYRA